MAHNQLQVILNEQGVATENARQLLTAFGAPFEEAGAILSEYQTIKVTEEDQFDLMAEARSKRLALKNIRVGAENKRKELKEDSLRVGRAIDSVARFVKDTIEPAEKYLEEQEKFAEIRQAERARKLLNERIQQLLKYTDDISMYNLDGMSEEQFATLLSGLKSQHETKLAEQKRIEDGRIAKEKAEREEQERIRAENARLKKEADERETKAAEERKATEEHWAKIRAEHDAEQKAAQAKLDEEREKREVIEKQQREAVEKVEAERRKGEELRCQSLLAPDKEKLLALAAQIKGLELPALSSDDAKNILDIVEQLLTKVCVYIQNNVEKLL